MVLLAYKFDRFAETTVYCILYATHFPKEYNDYSVDVSREK